MIEFDQNVADRLNEGMNIGGGVVLPFIAPTIWVVNGDMKMRQIGGAQYFGGWTCNATDLDDALAAYEKQLPPNFVETEIATAEGKSFLAYTCRSVVVAPIASRVAWVSKDGVRFAEFTPGARQHVQVIAYLASQDKNKVIAPMFPVVLSAKGFQAKNLLNAFGSWHKHIASPKKKVAPNVPAWLFYLAIGTFGQERKQIMVGGNGSQSPITPIGPYLPEGLTPETLESLFVGNELAGEMVALLESAKEWLSAWKTAQKEQPHAWGNNGEPPMPEEPPDNMGDVPF